jgi:hypothetical protein
MLIKYHPVELTRANQMVSGIRKSKRQHHEVTPLKQWIEAVPGIGTEQMVDSQRNLRRAAAIRENAHPKRLRPHGKLFACVT